MAMIYVKVTPGKRTAYYEGRVIPQDKFVAVNHDQYIDRLITRWGDLEAQQQTAVSAPKPVKQPERPAPTAQTTPANPAPGTGAPKPIN